MQRTSRYEYEDEDKAMQTKMLGLIDRGLYTLSGDLFVAAQLDNGTWALYTRECWNADDEWTYTIRQDGCIRGSGFWVDDLHYEGCTADEMEQESDKDA